MKKEPQSCPYGSLNKESILLTGAQIKLEQPSCLF